MRIRGISHWFLTLLVVCLVILSACGSTGANTGVSSQATPQSKTPVVFTTGTATAAPAPTMSMADFCPTPTKAQVSQMAPGSKVGMPMKLPPNPGVKTTVFDFAVPIGTDVIDRDNLPGDPWIIAQGASDPARNQAVRVTASPNGTASVLTDVCDTWTGGSHANSRSKINWQVAFEANPVHEGSTLVDPINLTGAIVSWAVYANAPIAQLISVRMAVKGSSLTFGGEPNVWTQQPIYLKPGWNYLSFTLNPQAVALLQADNGFTISQIAQNAGSVELEMWLHGMYYHGGVTISNDVSIGWCAITVS